MYTKTLKLTIYSIQNKLDLLEFNNTILKNILKLISF